MDRTGARVSLRNLLPRRLLSVVVLVLAPSYFIHACTSDRAGDGKRSHVGTRGGKPFYRAAGSGPAFYGPGDLYTFLATGAETDGAYFQLEAVVPPGGGPPPHIHQREAETFFLAEGTLEMQLGEQTVTARAGDFVSVPRGTVHGFRNVGTAPARMVVTFVPAGFEKFFENVFEPARDRSVVPPTTEALIQRMTAEAPKYGCSILPPPSALGAGSPAQ